MKSDSIDNDPYDYSMVEMDENGNRQQRLQCR